MVVFLDIDKFITKDDLRQLSKSKWPWKKTHFLIMQKCYACRTVIDNSTGSKPIHIVLSDIRIKLLLRSSFFWCPNCSEYSVYDHYPSDECYYCN